MMFDLPDDPTLYAALLARDPACDGRAYMGVTCTGIFCRLTCPARKPKPENCRFHTAAGDCIAAGFCPCKRCHPLAPMAEADPVAATLLAAPDARPDVRWGEGDVAAMGFDPSTVRRGPRQRRQPDRHPGALPPGDRRRRSAHRPWRRALAQTAPDRARTPLRPERTAS